MSVGDHDRGGDSREGDQSCNGLPLHAQLMREVQLLGARFDEVEARIRDAQARRRRGQTAGEVGKAQADEAEALVDLDRLMASYRALARWLRLAQGGRGAIGS